jgi:hypothetical protein
VVVSIAETSGQDLGRYGLREASASEPRSRPEADLKQLREFANTEVW